jgi:signal transduction histidine kinase
MKIVDPVCGMAMDGKDIFGTSLYKGSLYYFCSKECKDNFDRDPETLLGMKQAREKKIEEERSRVLEKMMDELAHGVRNPLTSIGGFVRRVYERLPEGDPNKKYLEIALQDVSRLENMIRELIDLVTASVSHKEHININDLILDVLKSFQNEFDEQSVDVRTELFIDPPSIDIDRDKIAMALANLIKNAIEAMHNTPRKLTITSCLIDKYIVIKISDSGEGISQDSIKEIFDPFFSTKAHRPGLGLTFTQRIINEHGGSISVDSEPGMGAIFTIRLPF